jgi:diguanylate cyclase (GGDEF)-like protein
MHVVIIDPSRVVQHKLAAEVEASGCDVDCFSASDVALEFVKTVKSVDIVLTSLELEPFSGLELCWTLRTVMGDKRPLHIIAMSSNTNERSLSEALDCGADDFVQKPVRRDELRARLRAADRMMALQRQLVGQAETDPLTGVLNRWAFAPHITESRADLDASEPLALCRFDIDHFKRVIDEFGHDVSDAVLRAVAEMAAEESSLVARLDGWEFAMAFPVLGADEASRWCDVIRGNIAARCFEAPGSDFYVTGSFGLTEWPAGEPLADALRRANEALLDAKRCGRNRISIARLPAKVLDTT